MIGSNEMKYNYHTHTSRCNHADGSDEEYVLKAIEAGFDEIGFSDHTPWPYKGFVSTMRMREEELASYVKSIKSLREKYSDKISIKLGLECEYFKEYIPWLREVIDKYGLDYVILGHHFTPNEQYGVYNGFPSCAQDLINYKNEIIEAVDTGLFSYIAHPDLFMRGYTSFDKTARKISKEIILKSIEADVPIEYNLMGVLHSQAMGREGYPYGEFWKMAGELGATAVIGIDAHSPDSYTDYERYRKAEETLKTYGVRLTDKIKFLR